jgi:hypothetical protein
MRESLIPTPANALTAARFPAAFAGDNGSPNLSRLGSCQAEERL